MVFDAEAADRFGTRLDVIERVHLAARVVHHVAGVVVDLNVRVGDFADDLASQLARFAVLFDDDQYSVIAGDRAELLESFDPDFSIRSLCMTERQSALCPDGFYNPSER